MSKYRKIGQSRKYETRDDNGQSEVANNSELRTAINEVNEAFVAFKEANDKAIEDLKAGQEDVVQNEKVDRINDAVTGLDKRLQQLVAEQRNISSQQESSEDAAHAEFRDAADLYMRKGEVTEALEQRSLSVGNDPDGGFLVFDENDTNVTRILSEASPMRSVAQVVSISRNQLTKPVSLGGAGSGWVGEKASRPETATPTLSELRFPTMELYAMPAATQTLLDDDAVDLGAWLAEEVRIAFAEQEGAAHVTGDGNNKPRGFLDYPQVADASYSWGNLGYIVTGVSGGFNATNGHDNLVDLIYAVKAGYRQGAQFVYNRSTLGTIRKIKDGDNNYIWQPSVQAGQPSMLLGYGGTELEDMPDIGADSISVAFGDFRRGYLIVDRIGIRVLRDPFSNKPYIQFYTTKRVGGGVQNFEAIKLLKFGTS